MPKALAKKAGPGKAKPGSPLVAPATAVAVRARSPAMKQTVTAAGEVNPPSSSPTTPATTSATASPAPWSATPRRHTTSGSLSSPTAGHSAAGPITNVMPIASASSPTRAGAPAASQPTASNNNSGSSTNYNGSYGSAAQRCIVVRRPSRLSNSTELPSSDVNSASATTTSQHSQSERLAAPSKSTATTTCASPRPVGVAVAVPQADVTVIHEVPFTPRGRAHGAFTVAGDESAASASVERPSRRSSQSLGGTSHPPPPPLPASTSAQAANLSSRSGSLREQTPAGSGARAAQYQQQHSPSSPPPLSGPTFSLSSPSAPAPLGSSSAGGSGQVKTSGVPGVFTRSRASSSSTSSSSSSSEYNSSFSDEQEEEEESEDARDDSVTPTPRRGGLATPQPAPKAAASKAPTALRVAADQAGASLKPAVATSASTTSKSSVASRTATTQTTASVTAPKIGQVSHVPPRRGLLPHLQTHPSTTTTTTTPVQKSVSSSSAVSVPASALAHPATSRDDLAVHDNDMDGDDDDEDDDFDGDDFDEEDEEQAVLSYMDYGARELRRSLQLSQHQPVSSMSTVASPPLSGPTSGRFQADSEMPVLSGASSPRGRPCASSSSSSPVMRLTRAPGEAGGVMGVMGGVSPRAALPIAAASVPTAQHVKATPGTAPPPPSHSSNATASAKRTPAVATATAAAAPHATTSSSAAAAAAAAKKAAGSASASSSPPSQCRGFSLYEAFYLDRERKQWLVDDLVLAKVLEYVRLMGYEHPLARSGRPSDARPGATSREPSMAHNNANTATQSTRTAVETSRESPASDTPSPRSPLPQSLLWSSAAAVASPLAFAANAQERLPCLDGVHRLAALRLATTGAADSLESAHKLSTLLFLDQVEPLRWISEQEYVIGTVLLCCAHADRPAPSTATAATTTAAASASCEALAEPVIPPSVHPLDHVVHLVQSQFAQWGSLQAFEQLWETQVRLVLGTASPSHQRVFASPDDGITFSSDFEGGNLWNVEKAVEPYYYYLWLEPDLGSDKRIWFRFAVTGAVEGRTLRFRLLNAATHSKLYRQHGMAPVWRDGAAQPYWTAVDQCSFRVSNGGSGVGARSGAQQHHHHHSQTQQQQQTGASSAATAGESTTNATPPAEPSALEDNGEVSFSIVPRSANAVIQVAFCVPYTYADLLCHVCHWHALVKSSVCSIRFEERVLCRTPDGRKLHLLIITSPNDATKKAGKYDGADGTTISKRRYLAAGGGGGGGGGAESAAPGGSASASGAGESGCGGGGGAEAGGHGKDGKGRAGASAGIRGPYSNFGSGKKVVLISARVHPGEVTASHGCHGLISFLLSSDPRAVRLREHYLFFIVPMLNPDGVSRGHSRFDQFGNNLNRCYNAPDPTTQPTVFALRNVFQHLELSFQERFFLYIDFHSHASQSSGFMFGNALPKTVHHWNMVFPKLVELQARDVFSFALCRFGKMQMSSKDGASRVLFGSTLIHSYTVELTYFTDGKLYADTFLAMNNRGAVILDASVSGPEYFQSGQASTAAATGGGLGSPPPGGATASSSALPSQTTSILGSTQTTTIVATPPSSATTTTAAATSAGTSGTGGGAAASATSRRSRTPAAAAASPTGPQPASVTHRKRSLVATAAKRRARSTTSSTTTAAARRRTQSEGASSPRRSRRSLMAELIPGARPGRDVPVPVSSTPTPRYTMSRPTATSTATATAAASSVSNATTTTTTPRYLHGIAMPTILCQSALVGQACLFALLDYGVVGGPRALSGELVSYGGMDHVLTEVKRTMTRKTGRKKRAGGTPNIP